MRVLFIVSALCLAVALATEPEKKDDTELEKTENDPGIGYGLPSHKICYGMKCRRVPRKKCAVRKERVRGKPRCTFKTNCGHDPHGYGDGYGYGYNCKKIKVCNKPVYRIRRKRYCWRTHKKVCRKVPKRCGYGGYNGGHGKICYGKKCRRVQVGRRCYQRRVKKCERQRCMWKTQCGHDGGYNKWGYGHSCKKVKVCHRPRCYWRRKRVCRPKYGRRCYKVPKKCPYYPGGHGPHYPGHGKICYGKKCRRVRVGRKCTMRRRKDCSKKRCVWQTKCGHDGGYGREDYGYGYNCKKVRVCRPHCIWRRKRACWPKYGRRCYKVPKRCPYYPAGYGPHHGGHKRPAYGKKCYGKVCRLHRRRVKKVIIVKRRRKVCGFKKVKSYHCGYHHYHQGGYGYGHGYGLRSSCYKKVKRCRNIMVPTPKAVWRIRKRKVCRRVPKRCPHYY